MKYCICLSKLHASRTHARTCHFETRSELDTEKKVAFASVATALAKKDLPVPGGCVGCSNSETVGARANYI